MSNRPSACLPGIAPAILRHSISSTASIRASSTTRSHGCRSRSPPRRVQAADLSLDDARLAIARWYDFRDWPALVAYVEAVSQDGRAFAFEAAVEAAGAEPDALADMYGAECTTMSMLVSSSPRPQRDCRCRSSSCSWISMPPSRDAACGNGVGHCSLRFSSEWPAPPRPWPIAARHRALSLAAQHGRTEIVRLLLDACEDPNRYNPEHMHAHTTPLHQAVLGGHARVVRVLAERGARLDIRDTIWDGTPLGWAVHGGEARAQMAEYLRSLGAAE